MSTMPNARYTVDRARRLAFVRQLQLRAERDAELAEPMCVQALLGIHDAAELLLVLSAEALSAPVKASSQFLEYWQPLDDTLAPDQLGHKASMKAVSDARRGLKHSGVMPSRSEIQRFTRATREFLSDATMVVFAVDFDHVSMSDLIPERVVRDHIKTAEGAAAARDLKGAVGSARLAFESLMRPESPDGNWSDQERRRRKRRESFTFDSSFFLKLGNLVDKSFGRAWDKLIEAVTSNETAILMLARGVNYDAYLKFEELTPHAYWTLGADEPTLAFDARVGLTTEDVSWCIEFATLAALSIRT